MNPAPGLTIEQQSEPIVCRMCLWAEARGEEPLGQLAILYVLENRAVKRDTTLKAEVLRPMQFSSFNDNDPNRPMLLKAFSQDPIGWRVADVICELYEKKATANPVGDSTHYYNPSVVSPSWGRGHVGWKERAQIGRHVFGVPA